MHAHTLRQCRLWCHHLLWSLQQNNISPSDVVQWSNHRVMEWLRSVDLAEYAPNLRGSGVHGGLIVRIYHFTTSLLKIEGCNINHILSDVHQAEGNKHICNMTA